MHDRERWQLEELRITPDHQSVRKKGLSPTIAGTGFYPTLILKVDSSPDPGAKSPARCFDFYLVKHWKRP